MYNIYYIHLNLYYELIKIQINRSGDFFYTQPIYITIIYYFKFKKSLLFYEYLDRHSLKYIHLCIGMRSLCYIVFDKSSYYITPVEQDFTDIVMRH